MAFIRVTISERGPTFVKIMSPRPTESISLKEELVSLKLFLQNNSGTWQSRVGDIPVIHQLARLIKQANVKQKRQARITRRIKHKN